MTPSYTVSAFYPPASDVSVSSEDLPSDGWSHRDVDVPFLFAFFRGSNAPSFAFLVPLVPVAWLFEVL